MNSSQIKDKINSTIKFKNYGFTVAEKIIIQGFNSKGNIKTKPLTEEQKRILVSKIYKYLDFNNWEQLTEFWLKEDKFWNNFSENNDLNFVEVSNKTGKIKIIGCIKELDGITYLEFVKNKDTKMNSDYYFEEIN